MRLEPTLMGCLLLCLIHTAHTTAITPIGCREFLAGDSGRFSTPGYPKYVNNLDCSWWIIAAPGSRITLTLDRFDVEYEKDCEFDSLKIYDGASETDTLLGSFCGNDPFRVKSSGDILYLRFTSDNSHTDAGFTASWTSETQDTTDCYEGNGVNYRGEVFVTENGAVCLPWSVYPWYTRKYPGKGLGFHNYCRNPNDEKLPWCWVDYSVERKIKDYCKIERCSHSATDQSTTGTTTYRPTTGKTTYRPTTGTTTYRPTTAASTTDGSRKCGVRPFDNNPPRSLYGGEQVLHGYAPWQVRVQNYYSELNGHHCGAVIISEYWLLSAAHCFEKAGKSDVRMIVGDHDVNQYDKDEQTFEVDDIISHKDYDRVLFDNDIALIKVKPRNGKGIVFSHNVQPACLPTEATAYTPGTECIISGWGDRESEDKSRETLVGTEVPLIAHSRCKQAYEKYNHKITTGMTCAGYLDKGKVDTCQGDSGGPLVCRINGSYTLLGITSWGEGCGESGKPGVYAKVQHYLTWIDQHIKKHSDSFNQKSIPSKK